MASTATVLKRIEAAIFAEPKTTTIGIEETEIETWFERDRAHVELRDRLNCDTIVEWWDEEVWGAVEDGFLDARDWHGSAFEYAQSLGLIS